MFLAKDYPNLKLENFGYTEQNMFKVANSKWKWVLVWKKKFVKKYIFFLNDLHISLFKKIQQGFLTTNIPKYTKSENIAVNKQNHVKIHLCAVLNYSQHPKVKSGNDMKYVH